MNFAVTIPPGDPNADVMSRVWELKAAGRTIDAIKELRQLPGWGLKEAKAFVDTMSGPTGDSPASDPHGGVSINEGTELAIKP